uniref:N-acetylglucosamine-6-phosphate deacetylase n=1 Tax=Globisporangium ultimum (strain ATCC 200006 / CBS 805.95 / DAOM BR144) TaxID=431595 RepID=K3WPK7_GLOUD
MSASLAATPSTSVRVLKIENVRVLRQGKLQRTSLWVVDGKIADPQTRFWTLSTQQELAPHAVIDGRGCIASPGFIDIQLNGGFGHDFSNPDITEQQILDVAQRLVATGVTAFCPTLVSSSADVYSRVASKYMRTHNAHTRKAANMLGLHLEGPFISTERKGAHNESVLLAPVDGIVSLEQRYGALDNVAIITLAPELEGAMDTIQALSAKGIVTSAGHSVADVNTAIEAADRGLTMLTHVFNAMGPFHHRDPGLIGLLGLTHNRPYYGLILDGLHSHRTSARIIRSCHPEGLVLVTDAMAGLGLAPAEYVLAGERVDVKKNGAFLVGTDTIAGSIVTMDSCVRTLIEYTGCSIEEALVAASTRPAQVLGIANRKGTLEFGADADFVLLNDDLHVLHTYIAGELVFDASTLH